MLSVQGLSKTFRLHRLGRDLTLFAGVEFTLRRGEFLLLQGQNGVGKSSLLKCIYGTYRPSAGKILLETPKGLVDVVQSGPRTLLWLRRHVVGYVSQFLEPRPRTTVLEVVMEVVVVPEVFHELNPIGTVLGYDDAGRAREFASTQPHRRAGDAGLRRAQSRAPRADGLVAANVRLHA